MKPHCLFLLFFIFISPLTTSAQSRQTLNEKIFRDSIMSYGWAVYDSTSGKLLVLKVEPDSCSMVYFDILEGISGNYCTYTKSFGNNFFRISFQSCQNKEANKINLYGYLDTKNQLHLLVAKEERVLDENLFALKGWIQMEEIRAEEDEDETGK